MAPDVKGKLYYLFIVFSVLGSYFFSFYIISLGDLIHSHGLNYYPYGDVSQIWTFSSDVFYFLQVISLSRCSTDVQLSRWSNWTPHLPPTISLLSFVSISWSKSKTWVVTLTFLHIFNHKSYNFCLLNLSLGSLHISPFLLPLP